LIERRHGTSIHPPKPKVQQHESSEEVEFEHSEKVEFDENDDQAFHEVPDTEDIVDSKGKILNQQSLLKFCYLMGMICKWAT
jgi:hypothetical protein